MSLVTAKALREQRANLAKQAEAVLDKARAEERHLTTEEQQTFDKFHTECESIRENYERIEKQEKINAELSESAGRQAGGREQPGAGAETRERPESRPGARGDQDRANALRGWLMRGSNQSPPQALREAAQRHGVDVGNKLLEFNLASRALRSLTPEGIAEWEKRTQSTTTGDEGGYTVPNETMRAIEVAMVAEGGMRQVADIIRTDSGSDLPWPTVNDTETEGEIIGQNGQVNPGELTFGQKVLKAFKYSSKMILIPIELLQDSAVNIAEVVGTALGQRIGRVSNKHFTIGGGTTEPWGIVTRSVEGAEGDSQTEVEFADLVELEHSVDPRYRLNAKWMFADSTLKALKQLVDGQEKPLWLPGVALRQPDTILGYSYVINQSVPEMEADAKSIVFGDLSKYKIRDVRNVTLMRLDERFADYHQVAFLAFSRHDGDLLDAGTNPVKHFKNAS